MFRDTLCFMRAILIIAYKRANALSQILESCRKSGIKNIFIHIDGPKDSSSKSDVEKVRLVAENFSKLIGLNIQLCIQRENLGCAVSLVTAMDTVLGFSDEVIVLEDDCIPGADFWKFADQSFDIMKTDPSIGLFCGPQFGPKNILSSEWFLSSYPFHWGWGINSSRWFEIRAELCSPVVPKRTERDSISESRYWNAGCQRALNGMTDVWDTLFVRQMRRLGLKALLPPENLIQNLGNDRIALHTSENSVWTNKKIGNYPIQNYMPKLNSGFEDWARSEYFGISPRHLLSTRMTSVLDRFKRKKYQNSLEDRLNNASAIFLL